MTRLSPSLSWTQNDVFTYDLQRKTLLRLSFDKRSVIPIFSPDGKRIFYTTGVPPAQEIWSRAADGSGAATRFMHSNFNVFAESVSPDGATLAYVEDHPETSED